jgi:hypothetical protein
VAKEGQTLRTQDPKSKSENVAETLQKIEIEDPKKKVIRGARKSKITETRNSREETKKIRNKPS